MVSKQNHAFLDPLWRRVLLVASCAVWTIVELLYGDTLWVSLIGALTVYAAWAYLYAYKPADRPPG